MAKSNDIAAGIYKGWLAIVGTRLIVSCLALIIFGLFMICIYIWFVTSLVKAPPLQFRLPTPLK